MVPDLEMHVSGAEPALQDDLGVERDFRLCIGFIELREVLGGEVHFAKIPPEASRVNRSLH
jgi:hypothetical protein